MTKKEMWNSLKEARRYQIGIDALTGMVLDQLEETGDLEKDMHASNSNTLEETIMCYVQYGEDKDILEKYFNEE